MSECCLTFPALKLGEPLWQIMLPCCQGASPLIPLSQNDSLALICCHPSSCVMSSDGTSVHGTGAAPDRCWDGWTYLRLAECPRIIRCPSRAIPSTEVCCPIRGCWQLVCCLKSVYCFFRLHHEGDVGWTPPSWMYQRRIVKA